MAGRDLRIAALPGGFDAAEILGFDPDAHVGDREASRTASGAR